MKVSKLIEILQQHNKPDDEILALWWEKESFDFSEDDELVLTDEAWLKVVQEHEKHDSLAEEIGQSMADAVVEYSEMKSKFDKTT